MPRLQPGRDIEHAASMVLEILSPEARRYIYLLRTLTRQPVPLEALRRDCSEALSPRTCRGLTATLKKMTEQGIVEETEQGYRLTSHGAGLASALREVEEEIGRTITKSQATGLEPAEIYTHIMTPIASMLGIAEISIDEDYKYALIIHAYISLLSAASLSIAAETNPKTMKALKHLEEELEGEEKP